MDQGKIGKFIAALRREQGLTQEQLGEKLGVTNKTVSRWENGNYMPDIETLQLLSAEFSVSINEILAGERLSEASYRERAEENVKLLLKESIYTREESEIYWKTKWKKENLSYIVCAALASVLGCVLLLLLTGLSKPVVFGLLFFSGIAEYVWFYNAMMVYTEAHVYDGKTVYAEKQDPAPIEDSSEPEEENNP